MSTLLEDIIIAALRGRFRRKPKPVSRLVVRSRNMVIVEIEDRKPPCIVCGNKVPKGRHYTCKVLCQRKENLRVADFKKRLRDAQIPKMPMYRRVGEALGGLFN